MSEHEDHGFNANKIMISLMVLTAVEVAWGSFLPYEKKFWLWSGLLIMALWKSILIFMYFMHMKFEGWICKALIAPTPALILVVVFALLPDVALNDRLIFDVGDQLDPKQGEVVELGVGSRNIVLHPLDHGPEPAAVPASH